jgi:hypothetical protein
MFQDFLQFVPGSIAMAAHKIGEDACSGFEDQGSGRGFTGYVADAGKPRFFEFLKESRSDDAFFYLTECASRELHYGVIVTVFII